ncbi:MAG: outer membrane beta-barrel protein [Candidatus Aminicenantia bacterium]
MIKHFKYWQILLVSVLFFSTAGFSQVKIEFTGFGDFDLNLGFSKDVAVDPEATAEFKAYYSEWQPFFFDPVLEQKSGIGFGGRIAIEFTPQLAIEGSIEYATSKLQFNKEDLDALKAMMSSIGYTPYMKFEDSGGKIMRFYGNVVFNLSTEGEMIPYITAGLGITKFYAGPSVVGDRPAYQERLNLYYEDTSALTFNGGFGLKYFLSQNLGVKFDFRAFYCSPEFKQYYGYSVFGSVVLPKANYVTQKGSHLDASVNVGIFIKM